MREETLPFDPGALAPALRRLAERTFEAVPELKVDAVIVRRESATPSVEIDSPTADPSRRLVIWMDDGDEPSVGFGDWHTHASVWTHEDVIELIAAIVTDRFVLAEDVGGEFDGHRGVVDLRVPDALADELTGPHSSGRVRLLTWSGRGDREVAAGDLP